MMRRKHSTKSGFTLVEILIVVVIMGILAAILVPQFGQSGDDARYTATLQALETLRGQIDVYRNQHKNRNPGVAGANPDNTFVNQLTLPTNEAGQTSPNPDQGFGDPAYPYGPYITARLPVNPFNKSRSVRTVIQFPPTAPGGVTINDPGWIFEIISGRIRVNWDGTTPKGGTYWEL